jgi:aspartyl/asparaginyl-tRNA synthetase
MRGCCLYENARLNNSQLNFRYYLQICNNLFTFQGWIQKAHKQGAVSFIHLASDVTSDSVQVVVPKQVCRTFSIGGAVKLSGKWVKSSGSKQEMEILADKFTLLHSNQLQVNSTLCILANLFFSQ